MTLTAAVTIYAAPALAALSLTVSPVDGVDSIRFNSFDLQNNESKEVRIRVNSTAEEQYQVFIRTLEPLTNDKGVSLDGGALQFYSLPGSNGAGALYAQSPESISFVDELVYTSSQNGDSDAFNLVFVLDANRLNASGNFMGSLMITLRPVREGAVQESVLNVFVELEGRLKFTVESARGTDQVELSTADPLKMSDEVVISWQNGVGQPIRITQDADDFFRNEEGDLLDKQIVGFRAEAVDPEGVQILTVTPWQRARELIYSGNAPENRLTVSWQVNQEDLPQAQAGRYSGRVRYVIETDQLAQDFSVDLSVDIVPVFELQLKFPQGRIHFSELVPGSPPQEQEVEVTVKTNLGRPYTVVQEVTDPLANKKGDEISTDFFTESVEVLEEGNGRTNKNEFTPVKTGQDDVFYSDEKGSSASFKMIYRLRPYRAMQPGDYSAAVRFSLVER